MLSFVDQKKEIILPDHIEFTDIDDYLTKVTVYPLERGFGTTLGSSMRRILLSQLPGEAITSVEILGIPHEYSAIDSIKEDYIDLILNLKEVVLSLNQKKKKVVKFSFQGPKNLIAADLNIKDEVEILNQEQKICSIVQNKKLDIEITFDHGVGYVTSEELSKTDIMKKIGKIFIDTSFNPIKNVTFKIEEMRVGQKIGYDKLIMHVKKRGRINIKDAFAHVSEVLIKQLSIFFPNSNKYLLQKEEEEDTSSNFNPNLLKKITDLDLSIRSQNCMESINIIYLGDLATKTEEEMLKISNFGRKSLKEIKEILGKFKLTLGMEIKDWPFENIDNVIKKHQIKSESIITK